MNLFELFVKIGVDDQASGKLKDLGGKLGNGLKTAAKIGTAAVATAAAGITALTTAAVNNYAEYEQLVGGVETLFGKSADAVMKYAENAYMAAGMSANEYMSTVTGFSASLLQGLGGDTKKAAEIANLAVQDMSDNANKMGTSMEMIQNAYQGFAKDNFTMLDNLKLGYGGTAGEMARLINDSGVLGDAIEVTNKTVADVPFDKVIEAINVIQTRMGITGTTALEAGRTISGSVGAMKSAWTNLLTGLADGNADIESLVDNLVTTIVGDGTESNLGVLGNIMPAVETALNGAAKLVKKLVPATVKLIPNILKKNLPILVEAAIETIESLIESIDENKDLLSKMLFDLIKYLVDSFTKLLPQIVKLGLDVIVSLASGISKNISKLLPTITNVIFEIVEMLTDKETLSSLLTAAIDIIKALADHLLEDETLDRLIDAAVTIIVTITELLIENVDKLIDAAVKIIEKLVEYLTDAKNLKKLLSAGVKIINKLVEGLISVGDSLSDALSEITAIILEKFLNIDLSEAGKKAIKSFISGLSSGLLGFSSAGGIGADIAGSIKLNTDGSHRSGLDYVPYDGYIAELHKGERVLTASEARGYGGTSIGNINITVNGAKYDDEHSLAVALAQEIQDITDRRAAVYA